MREILAIPPVWEGTCFLISKAAHGVNTLPCVAVHFNVLGFVRYFIISGKCSSLEPKESREGIKIVLSLYHPVILQQDRESQVLCRGNWIPSTVKGESLFRPAIPVSCTSQKMLFLGKSTWVFCSACLTGYACWLTRCAKMLLSQPYVCSNSNQPSRRGRGALAPSPPRTDAFGKPLSTL